MSPAFSLKVARLNRPRPANREELEQLLAYRVSMGEDKESAAIVVRAAYIAVYDDFVSCCPGYCGKVMVVLYDTAPEATETYVWTQGRMLRAWPEERQIKTHEEAMLAV